MKWVKVWIVLNILILIISVGYLHLNQTLHIHAASIAMIFIVSVFATYGIWKYHKMKFVEKGSITIQLFTE